MSVNWSIAQVKNYKELLVRGTRRPEGGFVPYKDQSQPAQEGEETQLDVATHTLIMCMQAFGYGSITQKNHVEFYARVSMYEKVRGHLRYGPAPNHEPVFYTPAEIERRIGLSTNWTDMTTKQWLDVLWKNYMREVQGEVSREPA